MKTCNNPRRTLTGLRAKAQNIFGCEGCFLCGFLEVTKTELSLFFFSFFFVKRKLTKKKKVFLTVLFLIIFTSATGWWSSAVLHIYVFFCCNFSNAISLEILFLFSCLFFCHCISVNPEITLYSQIIHFTCLFNQSVCSF